MQLLASRNIFDKLWFNNTENGSMVTIIRKNKRIMDKSKNSPNNRSLFQNGLPVGLSPAMIYLHTKILEQFLTWRCKDPHSSKTH